MIGVPMAGGVSDGLDALLAIVQMPKGVPVATVGVGNGENAGLLAAAILAVGTRRSRERLAARRAAQAAGDRRATRERGALNRASPPSYTRR